MKNIKAVRLENFQSHLDTYVEFNEGLNVIVGQSDSGKTAILRGIRWALYNQPRGTDFIRVSGDFVRVTVLFENETVIIRERTGSKNRYTIRKPGQEELVLEGFGFHVPVEVMEAHGMGHMRIDQDHELMIHLSQQLDGPFLLEQTSSIRAKTLGRISGAHFLDMAIRDTTKDLSQLNLRMKQEQSEIDKLKEELEPYHTLDQLKSKLLKSELKIEKLKSLIKQKEKLEQVKKQWLQIIVEEKLAIAKKQLVNGVDSWEHKINQLQIMVQQFVLLEQKCRRNKELLHAIYICQKWIKKTEHIELASRKLNEAAENLDQLKRLRILSSYLKELQSSTQLENKKIEKSAFIHTVNLNTLEVLSQKRELQQSLISAKERITQNRNQTLQVEKFYRKLPDVKEILRKQECIESASERFFRIQSIQAKLKDYQMRIHEGKRYMENQALEQEKAEQELQKQLLAAGTCPTCGQAICKHETIEKG
jgi:DNA repair exonuclease SbcCD ATPase subunit